MSETLPGYELATVDEYLNGFHTLRVDFKLVARRGQAVSLSWDEFDVTGDEDKLRACEILNSVVATEYATDLRYTNVRFLHATVPYGGMEDDSNPFRFMDPVNWRWAGSQALSDKDIVVAGSRALLELTIRTFRKKTNVMDAVTRHTESWENHFDRLGLERLVFRYMEWLDALNTRLWATKIAAFLSQGTVPIVQSICIAANRFSEMDFIYRLELGVRNLPVQKRRNFFVAFMTARFKQRRSTARVYYLYTNEHRRFQAGRLKSPGRKWRYYDALCVIFDAVETWRDVHLQEVGEAGQRYTLVEQPRRDYYTARNALKKSLAMYRSGSFFYDSFCEAFPAAYGILDSLNAKTAHCTSTKFWRAYLLRRILTGPTDVGPTLTAGTRSRFVIKVDSIQAGDDCDDDDDEGSALPEFKRARIAEMEMDE